jgi:hypothetical protein
MANNSPDCDQVDNSQSFSKNPQPPDCPTNVRSELIQIHVLAVLTGLDQATKVVLAFLHGKKKGVHKMKKREIK